ncbi:MAG TPA: hypothetical protein VHW23_27025 [Kofleriaceae bacterium]|jgi:hypothetical protein|nr:hypothetical protein [Kofleriaceae bacterium]
MGTALGLLGVSSGDTAGPDALNMKTDHDSIQFKMVVSAGAKACLPKASARVTIRSQGPVEIMRVDVSGLPPDTDFDFFVIQVPANPFGLSWYQGDIETDEHGRGSGEFIGRFSIETFIVAPMGASTKPVHDQPPFPDGTSSPAIPNPIHTHHLGLWFNSPHDAQQAGCASTVTPFNGDHNAGIQVLNTSNFPNDFGPLRHLQP